MQVTRKRKEGKRERGFTLLEVTIVLFLLPIILAVLIGLAKTTIQSVVVAERSDASQVFALYEDVKYNYLLSKSTSVGVSDITITRLDDCVITYRYDIANREINKSVSCPSTPAVNDRNIKVSDVSSFSVSPATGYFCFSVQRAYDYEPFQFCIGGM